MASTLKDAARKGVWGDTRLGHLSNGDRVFPAEKIDEHTAKQIDVFMRKHGLDPGRFTVGHKSNARNPHTRLPMFADGGGDPGGAGGDPGGGGGDPSGGGDASGGGETGGGANAAGTGGNIGGAGPGDNSGGGSETGGGANAPGTGGNISGAGPGTGPGPGETGGGANAPGTGGNLGGAAPGPGGNSETGGGANAPGTGGNIGNNPSGLGNPSSAASPGASGPTGIGLLDTMLQGFLSHPIQSAIDLGVGMIPGIGLANTALGALSSLTGGATPTAGSMATSAGRAIGDAFSGSGGLSGTGGTGPSPTGGAGGSAGLTGASAPSMGANSLVQAINNTPSVAAPAAAAAPAPSSAAAPPLGGGVGVPLTDMLFNTYRL